MKSVMLRVLGGGVLVATMLLWIHGGARMGLYHDSKAVVVRDALLGIEQTQYVPAFLPGVETLGLGFVAFFGLMVASVVMERRAR